MPCYQAQLIFQGDWAGNTFELSGCGLMECEECKPCYDPDQDLR
jgi:hypothetical protein